jgi:hypothetical protein
MSGSCEPPEKKNVAKRPEVKEGGREEERHPELATGPVGTGRLRNRKPHRSQSGQKM